MENYRDFPVVWINFKDMKFSNAKECAVRLKQIIAETITVFEYLQDSPKVSTLIKDRLKRCSQGGFGRYDIALFPENPKRDPGIIIEVKTRKKIQAALRQIELKRYDIELAEIKCVQIATYGFKFEKMVRHEAPEANVGICPTCGSTRSNLSVHVSLITERCEATETMYSSAQADSETVKRQRCL